MFSADICSALSLPAGQGEMLGDFGSGVFKEREQEREAQASCDCCQSLLCFHATAAGGGPTCDLPSTLASLLIPWLLHFFCFQSFPGQNLENKGTMLIPQLLKEPAVKCQFKHSNLGQSLPSLLYYSMFS